MSESTHTIAQKIVEEMFKDINVDVTLEKIKKEDCLLNNNIGVKVIGRNKTKTKNRIVTIKKHEIEDFDNLCKEKNIKAYYCVVVIFKDKLKMLMLN